MFDIDVSEANLVKDMVNTLYLTVRVLSLMMSAMLLSVTEFLFTDTKVIDANEIIDSTNDVTKVGEQYKDVFAKQANHAVAVVNVDAQTFEVEIVDPVDGKLHRIPANVFIDA